MAVDVAWSGVATVRFGIAGLAGDAGWTFDPAYPLACAAGTPGNIVALFDASGALAEMCYIATAPASTARFAVQGPLYLLIGRVDRCGLPYNPAPTESNPGANWQYSDSFWIAVDPKTGVIKTAEVVPNSVTARGSQGFIRAGLATGKL
jgi:hypothetical protein